MDFHTYTTMRDWTRRSSPEDRLAQDIERFYKKVMADAVKMNSAQFFAQLINERDWEKNRRPFYNLWPSIIPMLTRLDLDLDSELIRLPLPALCIRFPKDQAKNPLRFDWKGDEIAVRCILMGDMNQGEGISVLIGVGELMGEIGVPCYTYRNFPRKPGLTVEQSVAWLGRTSLPTSASKCPIPSSCLCSAVLFPVPAGERSKDISPDVLADDRAKFEASGDQRFVEKAHRRGKIGWDVGKHIEVIPHYRRPHMALVWTGSGGRCHGSYPGGAASCIGKSLIVCRAGLEENEDENTVTDFRASEYLRWG